MFPRIMPRLTWSSDMIGSTVVTCQGLLMNTNLSKKNFLDWVPFIQCVMEFFTQIHLAYFNKLQVGFDYQLLPSLVVNNNHPLFETKHVDWAWCPEWSSGFNPGEDIRGVYCIQLHSLDNLAINLHLIVVSHLVEEEICPQTAFLQPQLVCCRRMGTACSDQHRS